MLRSSLETTTITTALHKNIPGYLKLQCDLYMQQKKNWKKKKYSKSNLGLLNSVQALASASANLLTVELRGTLLESSPRSLPW